MSRFYTSHDTLIYSCNDIEDFKDGFAKEEVFIHLEDLEDTNKFKLVKSVGGQDFYTPCNTLYIEEAGIVIDKSGAEYRFVRNSRYDIKVLRWSVEQCAYINMSEINYRGAAFTPRLKTLWEIYLGYRDDAGKLYKYFLKKD